MMHFWSSTMTQKAKKPSKAWMFFASGWYSAFTLRMPVCLSKKIPLANTLLNTSQKTCVRLCCHCLRFWILPILTDPTYIFRKSWKHSPMSTAAYLPTRILSFQKSHRKSKTLLRKPGILIGGIFRLPFSALFLKARWIRLPDGKAGCTTPRLRISTR